MKKGNKYSIIIPHFNGYRTIDKALDSVYRQTYDNYEVILVDDCSEIRIPIEPHDKLTIIENTSNMGMGYTRNVGIQHATGDVIAFLDQDDTWETIKLESVESMIQNTYANLVAHSLKNLRPLPDMIWIGKELHRALLWRNFLPISGVCVKKKVFNNMRLFRTDKNRYHGVEDYELWLKITKALPNLTFATIAENLGTYGSEGTQFSEHHMPQLLAHEFNVIKDYNMPISSYIRYYGKVIKSYAKGLMK